MNRRIAAIVASLALAAPVGVALTSTEAGAAGLKYSNCDRLQRDYPHGVAKSRKAALKQVRQGNGMPKYKGRARKVYFANKASLDRDKDGTACES